MIVKQIIRLTGLISSILIGLFWCPARRSVMEPIQQMTSLAVDQTDTLSIRAVGDVMLGRSVNGKMLKYHDRTWPFTATIPHLTPADIFLGNLEAPIVTNCPVTDTGMVFCTPPDSLAGLAFAGFTAVSLANNHALNYGKTGMNETQQYLHSKHILDVDNYQSRFIDRNNHRLAIVALDDVTHPLDVERSTQLIQTAKHHSDVTIVLIHWGNEYQSTPSARQKTLAQQFFTAGSSIIIGSHPHVIQPIIHHDNTLVAYSLGNFVFDQMWSEATRQGLILDVTLTFSGPALTAISYQSIPVTIYDYGQPMISQVVK